jgi:single-stranded-DNA-specific exonuclease
MTLAIDQVEAFQEKFEKVVANTILPDQLIPEINIDQEIRIGDINNNFYSIICQMEPFGPENLRPVFILRNVKDTGYSKIVKEDHIRFSVTDGKSTIAGIGFGLASKFPLMQLHKPIDIACTLDENDYNNHRTLQLRVIDIRATES